MKKYLIPFVCLLASCASSVPSSSSSIVPASDELTDSMFASLSSAYAMEAKVTRITAKSEDYQTTQTTDYYCVSSQADGSTFAYQSYEVSSTSSGATMDNIKNSTNIVAQKSNKHAARQYLGIDNVIHTEDLTTSSGGTVSFSNLGLDECFHYLSPSLFSKGDAKREFVATSLNDEHREDFAKVGWSLLGDFACEIKTLTLYTDGYKVSSFKAEYKPYAYSSIVQYTYSIEGDFVSLGSEVTVKAVETLPEVGENALSRLFASLQNNNYSEFISYWENGVLSETIDARVNPTVFDYHKNDIAYGQNATVHKVYVNSQTSIAVAREINGEYYKYGNGYLGKVSSMLPKMKCSAACFDEVEPGVYHLKKLLPAISPSSSVYNVVSFGNIDDLTIKIEDSKATLTNVGDGFKEETIITNVGTTEISIDPTSIKNNCDDLSWKDLFFEQSEAYNRLVEYVHDESILSYIPTLGGDNPFAVLGVDDKYRELILPIGYISNSAQTALTNYITKLYEYGWTTMVQNIYGGYSIYRDGKITTESGLSIDLSLDLFVLSDGSDYLLYLYVYVD